ncbi:MAG: anti-sigma factor antagonist [Solirubrobacteraceae bacterium]|nr:anti-sigma factor antagonist [Solirubrobacteraceae bacterium]
MTRENFALELETLTPGLNLLAVSGEVDLFAAPELKETITGAIDGKACDLIVDLTRTAFIDSSGLAAVIMAMKRARSHGGRMVVVDGEGGVARTFRVAGVDQIVTIVASREAAVALLSAPAGR